MIEDYAKERAAHMAGSVELLLLFNAPPPGFFAMFLTHACMGGTFFFGNWCAESLREEARALAAHVRAPRLPALPLSEATRLMRQAAGRNDKALGRLETRLRKALVASLAGTPSFVLPTSTDETMCGLVAIAPWGQSPAFLSKTITRMTLEESGWRYTGEHPELLPLIRPAPPPSNTRH